jgi:DNA-binding MarR family transcriptional regulator
VGARDSVDALVADWRRANPSLDVAPLEIVQRVRRVHLHVSRTTEEHFTRRGLSGPAFAVLSVLMRQPAHAGVRQRRLADQLQLSPGTVSLRIDQLEADGLVERRPDPDDRRGAVVTLTDAGRRRFRDVADDHLALQDLLLGALDADERAALSALLRRLLISYEPRPASCATRRLGVEVAPAHEALALQRRVGVPPQPGLLVTAVTPESPAAAAGLREGDLVVAADGRGVRSIVDLVDVLEARSEASLSVRRGDTTVTATVATGSPG